MLNLQHSYIKFKDCAKKHIRKMKQMKMCWSVKGLFGVTPLDIYLHTFFTYKLFYHSERLRILQGTTFQAMDT